MFMYHVIVCNCPILRDLYWPCCFGFKLGFPAPRGEDGKRCWSATWSWTFISVSKHGGNHSHLWDNSANLKPSTAERCAFFVFFWSLQGWRKVLFGCNGLGMAQHDLPFIYQLGWLETSTLQQMVLNFPRILVVFCCGRCLLAKQWLWLSARWAVGKLVVPSCSWCIIHHTFFRHREFY